MVRSRHPVIPPQEYQCLHLAPPSVGGTRLLSLLRRGILGAPQRWTVGVPMVEVES